MAKLQSRLLLCSLALVCQLAHAELPDVRGVWKGRIGEQHVLVCLDRERRSAFYFLRDGVERSLTLRSEEWQEKGDEEGFAHWHLKLLDRELLGNRVDSSGVSLPVRLWRYPSDEDHIVPCERDFFRSQPATMPDASVADPADRVDKNYPKRKVAAGDYHSAVIDADGGLWMWGSNEWGELATGDEKPQPTPRRVGGGFEQVFAAYSNTAAIGQDGTLWNWKRVKYVRPSGSYYYDFMRQKIGKGFVQVALNTRGIGFMALGQDGSIWADYLADSHSPSPQLFKVATGYMRISLARTGNGTYYAVGIKTDGSLWAWAYNGGLALDNALNLQRNAPIKVGDGFIDIESNWVETYVRKNDGSVWELNGHDAYNYKEQTHLLRMPSLKRIEHVYSTVVPGVGQQFGLTSQGELWAWGQNYQHEKLPLGDGTLKASTKPLLIDNGVVQLATGVEQGVALKQDGSIWFWGTHGRIFYHASYTLESSPQKVGERYSAVATSRYHTLAIKRGGSLYAWGSNHHGQLGAGKVGNVYNRPIRVGSNFSQVALGRSHSLALKKDHTLWAWGENADGQLGNGSLRAATRPRLIGKRFAAVAAIREFSMALKRDGSLWVWGSYEGSPSHSYRQRRVGRGFVKIVASEYGSLALSRDGSICYWENNNFSKPVRISALGTDVNVRTLISAHKRHYAISDHGRLWAWGSNYFGRLGVGDGDGGSPDLLQAERLGDGFVQLSSSDDDYSTLAVKKDGSLWAWGSNTSNQLSALLPRGVDQHTPTQVGRDFVQVSVAGNHALAIKRDGSLWAWGDSTYGQLGLGSSIALRPQKLILPAVTMDGEQRKLE